MLGATFLVLEFIAVAIYAVIGARLGRLSNRTRGLRWFNRASGGLMIGFGLMLAFLRRPASLCERRIKQAITLKAIPG